MGRSCRVTALCFTGVLRVGKDERQAGEHQTEHVLGRGPDAVKDRAGDAHVFIVRIRREPAEAAEAHRQWRGEFQHLHEGEEVTRRRFATVGAMLEAFVKTIRRITGLAGKSGSDRDPARGCEGHH